MISRGATSKGEDERSPLDNLDDINEACNQLLTEQQQTLPDQSTPPQAAESQQPQAAESQQLQAAKPPQIDSNNSKGTKNHTSDEHKLLENKLPSVSTNLSTEDTHTHTAPRESDHTHTVPRESTQTLKDHTPTSTENLPKESHHLSNQEGEPQIENSVDMKNWLKGSVKVLIEHLNRYGVCVVDNFLGDEKGIKTLDEIIRMQKLEYFKDGQVMSGGGQNQPTIRSDKITWTDGFSPVDCPYLRYAVRVLDSIVLRANRVKNNGELGKYKLTGRTRIMCACYPGGGTRYVRHIDNPNKDGRVVTAIYYLNKNWNSQVDGGSLRIYSQLNKGKVIQIDPIFDRVVFFWSDARNPHEVLPANKPRYAVTVWYLDEKEKQEYLKRSLEEYEMGNIGAQQLIQEQPCDKVNVIQGSQRPSDVIQRTADSILKPVYEDSGLESDIKKPRRNDLT